MELGLTCESGHVNVQLQQSSPPPPTPTRSPATYHSNTATTNMTHQLPPEVRALTEDDIYRTSSQFRVWSFSPESLAARRTKTHEIAIERIERQRNNAAKNALDNGQNNGEKLEYLTEHEELRLVQKYCDMIRATNDNLSWPANVKVREPCQPS